MKDFSFLLILVSLSLLGILFPEFFANLKPLILPLLIVIMLSMGLTLTPEDFKEIARKPFIVFYGALLQYTVMPLSGYLLSKLFKLPPELLVGVVLVGSAPGGTASNLITYLSRGDLSYSISMTTTSTLLSPLFTPLWTYVLAGKYVEVPFLSMFETTLKIVIVPVLLGMVLRYFLRYQINKVEKFLPFLAVFSISLIIAVIFALNSKLLKELSFLVLSVVLIHNVLGFLLGYLFGLLAGLDKRKVKALSIEVGMQNSGLSTVLALKYFSKVSALPSAIFSLSQNLIGVVLSLFFRRL
ncbi:bile acid:sodium symporter family transporter [Aquifex aeolicus]|uniref:Na(+) dependent transporter (Sbf family) n=1 Tax=Aquifex aeolicus (strain VF5) TaxID=224324 RepID=O67889_AQUAE|nr:bile acid:sodium symporter family transporter [Aquifex aeolicus]AAC07854.1 Na(+) dependent transporter (Sbf family) [Aquifex aeolicus VF5]